jgi:hypothetical protein
MKTFSIMEAAGEPFRLVGRRPLATLVWGLVMLLPAVGLMAVFMPMFIEVVTLAVENPDADPDMFSGQMAGQMFQFQLWSNLLNLIQLFLMLFVTTAIIRAVFAGKRGDGAAFLRIGMDELRVAVVGIAVCVGTYALMIVAVLLAVAVGFGLWSLPDPWRWLSCVGLGVSVFIGFLLLWGRLSLLAPASIQHQDFAFIEGWKMGRGQSWRLLGLLIVLILICLLMGVVFVVLAALVFAVIGGGMGAFSDPDAIQAWFRSLPERPGLLAGAGAILLLPMAYLQGFSQALMTAPYAYVVARLAPEAISTDTGSAPE